METIKEGIQKNIMKGRLARGLLGYKKICLRALKKATRAEDLAKSEEGVKSHKNSFVVK